MRKPSGTTQKTILPKIKDMLAWGIVFAGDILVAKGYDDEAELPGSGHVLYNGEEWSMQNWLRGVTG